MLWTSVVLILFVSYLTFINADEYMKREFSLVQPYFGMYCISFDFWLLFYAFCHKLTQSDFYFSLFSLEKVPVCRYPIGISLDRH